MACPSCSSEVPEGARFCPACGHNLLTQTDERRVATVLFGDIVGFTGLAESRDPEEVKHLVDSAFERLAADVINFGGHVDKVLGDAIVALFGAPIAHEDDAERAVRAALQMQRTLREVAAELNNDDLRMRIGVNTGEVLVGPLRAGGDYTAMGDVVNIASRLQTVAAPGQVVVGPATHDATVAAITYEFLGDIDARGREGSVAAWAAVSAIAEPGNRGRTFGFPLIGRDSELAMVQGAVDSCIAHRRPYLVLVIGEAGVGKSRLVNEVYVGAQSRHGIRYLGGRSLPYGQRNPWWLLAELVRMACGVSDEDAAGTRRLCTETVARVTGEPPTSPEVSRTVEALLYLLGVDGRLSDLDQTRARDEVTHGVEVFFGAMAAERPLLIAIGDLQWADDLVLQVIDRLLERLPRVPLVILATARPELMARWKPPVGGYNELVIQLDPLGEEAAGQLLTEFLGYEPAPSVRAELVSRAGGNALFLEELAALLKETGDLAPLAFRTLPATLRGLVAARLDALLPTERSVLDALAVLGRRGMVGGVVSVLAGQASASEVRAALASLHDKDMVELAGDRVEFVSDLVREVAYNTLSRAERARRHARLAMWLEDEAAKRDRGDEVLEELAHHWATAAELIADLGEVEGVPENVREIAMVALQRAAERADDRELHAVSGELFDQMVQLLGEERTGARRHALIGRARAATALHNNVLAASDLDVVEAEAEAAGDEVALARALVVRGDLLRNLGGFDESIAVLQRALDLWRKIPDRRGEASALRRIGFTYLYAGQPDLAEPFILEALDAFQEVGVRRGIAWAQQNLAWIAFARGEAQGAEARVRDSIALFQEIGDWAGESWAKGLLATMLSTQGHAEEAEELARRVAIEAAEHGDRWLAGMMSMVIGGLRLLQGQATKAVDELRGAWESFVELHDDFGLGRTLVSLSRALRLAGRIDEAVELIGRSEGITSSVDEGGPVPVSPVLTAQHAVELGQPEVALVALEDLPSTIEIDRLRGQALVQSGRFDEALEVLDRVPTDVQTMIATAFALVATGRVDEARQAAASARGLRLSGYLARALAEIIEACAAAQESDVDATVAHLDAAADELLGVDDRLTPAIVSLARAVLLDEPESRQPMADLGLAAPGWESIFRAASATAATA